MHVYDDQEKDIRKINFGKHAYELSQKFESDDMEIIAYTGRFRQQFAKELVNSDMGKVGMVLAACLIYMTFHTRSFFLAFTSILNVFMSVPICLVLYKELF